MLDSDRTLYASMNYNNYRMAKKNKNAERQPIWNALKHSKIKCGGIKEKRKIIIKLQKFNAYKIKIICSGNCRLKLI